MLSKTGRREPGIEAEVLLGIDDLRPAVAERRGRIVVPDDGLGHESIRQPTRHDPRDVLRTFPIQYDGRDSGIHVHSALAIDSRKLRTCSTDQAIAAATASVLAAGGPTIDKLMDARQRSNRTFDATIRPTVATTGSPHGPVTALRS